MTDSKIDNTSASSSDAPHSNNQANNQANRLSESAIQDAVNTTGYAGDVAAPYAYAALSSNAIIVDVRTIAEWNFVGLPALSPEQLVVCEWQAYPDMQRNPGFVAKVSEEILARSTAEAPADAPEVYFLCRSGARSRSAALAMTQAGFPKCFNIKNGFEGDPDADGHRGTVNGWKVDGLPWRQG
ncbi:rhodanese-like domain-containing protein [Pararhizobium sp. IMCC21322]|uniref:rhodanese-like domain-containing protein n=1 Tax=Pararhizobium sp. IMCC21322 TaxID=3067903 RepID=UPI002740936B|nr:rhodanese-like domain-containing protein [Pararhizobium sp. IMCC21322]